MQKLYQSDEWKAPKNPEFRKQLNKLKKYPMLAKSNLHNKFFQNSTLLNSIGQSKAEAIQAPNPFTQVNKNLVNKQTSRDSNEEDIEYPAEDVLDKGREFFDGDRDINFDFHESISKKTLGLGVNEYSSVLRVEG